MKCLYHANCNDGAGAALAVWMKYGGPLDNYIAVEYNRPVPDGLEDEDVIIVDFSYSKQQLRELAQVARSILVIDHHKTAKAELEGVEDREGCPIETVFDMGHSGAMLAWLQFHSKLPPPIFKYIEDRDLWNHRYPVSKFVHHALVMRPDWRDWPKLHLPKIVEEGKAIEMYLQNHYSGLVKDEPREFSWTGDIVPLYNASYFMMSDLLNLALNVHKDAPYAVGYCDISGRRYWSLRSRKGEDVDVSEIAKRFGGGGHMNAVGFVEELL